ncbi:MAG: 50S ribosomal protein L24 [Candidatus Shapirobacteria bacterium]|jgi:large subunit ribosomal protein L24|nr:50S ribosomal protein L24 [Candidatus Shapirobacteria bacterium]
MKILKGDTVKILIGKDKGREGLIVKTMPKKDKVVIKGLNLYKKHIKPSQGKPGSIVEKERAMTVSKVGLICPNCKKIIRVAYQIDKSGEKSRICRKCKTILNNLTIKK